MVGDRFREELELSLPGSGVPEALKGLVDKDVFKLPSSVKLLEVCLIILYTITSRLTYESLNTSMLSLTMRKVRTRGLELAFP